MPFYGLCQVDRLCAVVNDEAGSTLEGEIVPEPTERDNEAVPDSDQEINVCQAPKEPSKNARQVEATECHHGCFAPYRGRIAVVPILERIRGHMSGKTSSDQAADNNRIPSKEVSSCLTENRNPSHQHELVLSMRDNEVA